MSKLKRELLQNDPLDFLFDDLPSSPKKESKGFRILPRGQRPALPSPQNPKSPSKIKTFKQVTSSNKPPANVVENLFTEPKMLDPPQPPSIPKQPHIEVIRDDSSNVRKHPDDMLYHEDKTQFEYKDGVLDGEKRSIYLPGAYFVSIGAPSTQIVNGAFVMSNYMIYFFPQDRTSILLNQVNPDIFRIPLLTIQRVEKYFPHKKSNDFLIELRCKDCRILRFGFHDVASIALVYNVIKQFAFGVEPPQPEKGMGTVAPLGSIKYTFAFEHKFSFNGMTSPPVGWQEFDIFLEAERLNLLSPTSPWRVCHLNPTFEFSPTYPNLFMIPKIITDTQLQEVARFRSKARIPALCWQHSSGATLWRCSQPKVGMKGNRSAADYSLLNAIRKNTPSQQLHILDCRPKANALGNKAKGWGFEDYSDIPLQFLNIHNIHSVRNAYNKISSLSLDPKHSNSDWGGDVEGTHWLQHLRSVLSGSMMAAQLIHFRHASVLVHCSDGWDRTAQVCAIAMLLNDGYYRTLDGFIVLIQKEWLQMGHKFQQRLGHGSASHDDKQRSPVFIQFLDAVWQLVDMFPERFEFNGRLLSTIAYHAFSGRFGTFFCNSECERVALQLAQQTPSLWCWLKLRRSDFLNQDSFMRSPSIFMPPASLVLRNVRLWPFFLHYSPMASLLREDHWRQSAPVTVSPSESTSPASNSTPVPIIEKQDSTISISSKVHENCMASLLNDSANTEGIHEENENPIEKKKTELRNLSKEELIQLLLNQEQVLNAQQKHDIKPEVISSSEEVVSEAITAAISSELGDMDLDLTSTTPNIDLDGVFASENEITDSVDEEDEDLDDEVTTPINDEEEGDEERTDDEM
eukprot:TRINITY_DN8093_c0_g1_i1.p1 TRINITY_DN8093_c0_g1~~TRINITY_DN8093_c0_g1_i1.p1  ORF type:complete len:855 (-),score=276.68 TRINITY_DN8093_c0_g1_i1:296-2860(-)